VSDHAHKTLPADEKVTLGQIASKTMGISVGVGVAGLGLGAAMSSQTGHFAEAFGTAYLVGFAYFLSLSLGALFFVLIQHLSRAGWSVTVRRVAELMAANVLTMAVLAVPLFILAGAIWVSQWDGGHGHYKWGKAVWLTQSFFIGRLMIYLFIWVAMAWYYWKRSVRQDTTGDRSITEKLQSISGAMVVIFALTLSAAAFDLMMSLSPAWFSTMFAVIYFAGSFLGFFCALILILRFCQSKGLMASAVSVEHYHDLGKWAFGFVVFWAYVSFSQFMLIWYAATPEETIWYAERGASTSPHHVGPMFWTGVSLILLFGHFLIPFPGMISRSVKRHAKALSFWAIWLLLFHLIDLFWIIVPNSSALRGVAGGMIVPVVATWVGVGGFWVAGLCLLAGRNGSLIACKDPRLGEALAFENY
jgi:hypothetical protein